MNTAIPLSRQLGLFAGPLLFLLIIWVTPETPFLGVPAFHALAVGTWMIVWWVTEAVALPVTALLPIVLFPLAGVLPIKEAAASYANPIIFLFMGGFMLALALEKWKLHLRIALNIVRLTGTNANGIILGFMLATAALSMWISNTATTVMMLPIGVSVIEILRSKAPNQPLSKGTRYFSLSMMLGIAYAANIGGIATIIGTPPNTVLAGILNEKFGYTIDFARWLAFGFPLMLVLLGITYLFLVKILYPNRLGNFEGAQQVIKDELAKLGKVSKAERIVLALFLTTALAWIFKNALNNAFPAWKLTDATIAMVATVALFVTPVDYKKGVFVLEWKDTERLPWGILLLFGGGLSLATALSKVGIIGVIGDGVGVVSGSLSIPMIFLILIALMLFMTEIMSNVALTAVLVPVVAGIAVGLNENPLWMTIPVTIASSCAFMLPMATPPNAIVFASGHIKVSQMVKVGIWLNLIAVLLLALLANTVLPYVFDIQRGVLPVWAK
ncbi:DASS family sodium-coupled anion symporter [uncultured Microscilla sp.]|uniref:SLC13 family permease n=1 Tax=uncultured Microscilla sp. TaxID=432653 RepID=UPI00261E341A|nr:DASS family sodium-coupled anion symporter [uncultured Microscilla sp.]